MNNSRRPSLPLHGTHSPISRITQTTAQPLDSARLNTSEEVIPISIVSHSRLLRDGLVTLLSPHLLVRLVGSFGGNTLPDDTLPNSSLHTLLIDSGIGTDIISLWTYRWRSHQVPAHVLLLEVEDDKDTILTYIEMGISGYTLKEAPPAEVAQAICTVNRGLMYCSQEMIAYLCARLATCRANAPLPVPIPTPLTSREMDVLRCIAQGMSNKEIASALVIEIYTVKHHVHNILEKVNLHHRYEAVRFAAEQGWVTPSGHQPDSMMTQ